MNALSLTLGVEEEYQVVDTETGALHPYITHLIQDGRVRVKGIKPELHQSTVEVGTDVCRTPAEIRSEIVRLRRSVADLAGAEGLRIVSSGTHPFSCWTDSPITPLDRYLGLEEDNKLRVTRHRVDGNLVDLGKGIEVQTRAMIRELISEFLDDVLDELGSRKEVDLALRVLDEGSSAERQLRVYRETGDLSAVVAHLAAETLEGVD